MSDSISINNQRPFDSSRLSQTSDESGAPSLEDVKKTKSKVALKVGEFLLRSAGAVAFAVCGLVIGAFALKVWPVLAIAGGCAMAFGLLVVATTNKNDRGGKNVGGGIVIAGIVTMLGPVGVGVVTARLIAECYKDFRLN